MKKLIGLMALILTLCILASCEGAESNESGNMGSEQVSEENTEQGSEQGSEQNTEQGSEQGSEQNTEQGSEQGSEQSTEQGSEDTSEDDAPIIQKDGNVVRIKYPVMSKDDENGYIELTFSKEQPDKLETMRICSLNRAGELVYPNFGYEECSDVNLRVYARCERDSEGSDAVTFIIVDEYVRDIMADTDNATVRSRIIGFSIDKKDDHAQDNIWYIKEFLVQKSMVAETSTARTVKAREFSRYYDDAVEYFEDMDLEKYTLDLVVSFVDGELEYMQKDIDGVSDIPTGVVEKFGLTTFLD